MSRDRNAPLPPATTPPRLAECRHRAIGAAALATFVTFAPIAMSCGYEDPKSAAVQRGVLNWAYPQALHVLGALTQARMQGVVAPPSEDPAAKDPFGLQLKKTARMLQQFADMIGVELRPDDDLAFSMVLLEPMLWTRFAVRDGRLAASVHTDGPAAGDVVMIASEAALREVAEHRLTPKRTEELGLVRLYGDPTKIARLRAIIAGS